MHALVAIEDARLEYDHEDFVPSLVFGGRLNLTELQGFGEWDRDGYQMDSIANSIGHEIIRQARVLYALTKDHGE